MAAAARQLFFAYKKKVSLCTPSARRQLLATMRCLGAAGLKKHLPVVTTARSRALDFGSVAAAAMQLFFACEKKFHCAHRVHAGNSSRRHEVLGAAGLKKHLPADKTHSQLYFGTCKITA